jgi:hypothetical protein
MTHLSGPFQDGGGLLTLNGRELLEKIIQRSAAGDVIEQRFYRHARAGETRRSALNVGINLDGCSLASHTKILA